MPLIDDVIALYRVDSQWRGLRSRVDSARDVLRIRERKLGETTELHEEADSRLRQTQATLANLEGESTDFGERIEKLRSELNASTTDKQYQAILGEMKSLQTLRDEVDSSQLAEMERLETMNREAETLAEQVADRRRLVEVARAECQECENAVAERLGELEGERNEAASRIPEKIMSVFDEVAEQHEGESMAAVIEVSKRHREYSCGACHVQMPYYLVVNLHDSSSNGVQQCPNCDRILFLETAETEA